MRSVLPVIAATLLFTSLTEASTAEAANRPRWTHVAITQGRHQAVTLSVTYVTDTAGEASTATAVFPAPFDGPTPYQSTVTLSPEVGFTAVARTRIGFSGDATGFTYPLILEIKDGAGGINKVQLDALVRPAGDPSAEDEDGGAGGDASATGAEILALEDQDGDGAPDAYRVVVTAAGNPGANLKEVSVSFLDTYAGPAPHAKTLTVPFKVFKQTFASPDLYFDGDPSRFTYSIALTPNGADGQPVGEAETFKIKVKGDSTPPAVSGVADRTAPVVEVCAGGPEESAGDPVTCSDAELELLISRLAKLHERVALGEAAAAQSEAKVAYLGGKEPWSWTDSRDILSTYLGNAAAAGAGAQLLSDVIVDGLIGLSATELVQAALIVDARFPEAQGTMTAHEAGQRLGGGFYLSGLTPVPIGEGEIVFEDQIVVGGFAFDPREVLGALNNGTVRTQKTHPTGLRLGISKGWEKSQVLWDSLAATPEHELALHPAFEGAQVAVLISLPQEEADAARAAAVEGYQAMLDGASASLAARGGGGTWSSDPVFLRHRYDAQAGQVLSLPGVLNVLNDETGALVVGLEDGRSKFIPGDKPASDPASTVLAHVNGGGLTGRWTFDDMAAQDASVSWRLGSPAVSVDEATAVARLAAEDAVDEAAAVEALRLEIAGATAAIQALEGGPYVKHVTKSGTVIILDTW